MTPLFVPLCPGLCFLSSAFTSPVHFELTAKLGMVSLAGHPASDGECGGGGVAPMSEKFRESCHKKMYG